ncbi:hypothetical protein RBH26_20650 [Natronolimnohabitans sp. A-GB9]|uniref:hypothetical protein n=1 Tax=Natronolimnohabitans sp. A-GB9 TaxID=3069757 RepID=UPI0027B4C2C1|nr:hypothetical protein [Natronolimnohabitans sp. A-GB9]MDQ2052855.1 hypothetical protein [Natronolimnohabitans sp. A-GB9]
MLEILQQIPFQYWKHAKREFRRRFATVEWPEYPDHVTVAMTADELEACLRNHHFEDGSGWSLKYDGEVLNMRRPAGTDDQGRPLEEHLRFRPADHGLEGNGHIEPSRWEEKTRHVEEEGLEWLSGGELASLLESTGVDPDTIAI